MNSMSYTATNVSGTNTVHIADQGYFWVGLKYITRNEHTVLDGTQMYVEYQKPANVTQKYPVILIHGGGGQSLDWISTPDGRPGWRTLLLQQGYEVYIVDRPGHGRSPSFDQDRTSDILPPAVETLGTLFAGQDNPEHTQWPGAGDENDLALAQLLASQGAMTELSIDHQLMQQHGVELLERIGRSIIITSSAGGPSGWLMADTRPDLVAGVIALEPLGPSGAFPLTWGLAATPMNYQPDTDTNGIQLVSTLTELSSEPLRLQPEPARQLPNLADLPIAVVSSDQSFTQTMDLGTIAFLEQAGCKKAELIKLADHGLQGNGHLMMIERNNAEVLDLLLQWIDNNINK